jgi:hypothetical protein
MSTEPTKEQTDATKLAFWERGGFELSDESAQHIVRAVLSASNTPEAERDVQMELLGQQLQALMAEERSLHVIIANLKAALGAAR